MERNKNILTKDGLKELKLELKKLIEVERPRIIEDIADARAQGDLSENAEFDVAREEQGQVEDRIKEIESIIENSKIVSTTRISTKVRVGSQVKIKDINSGEESNYLIVGSLEADPFQNKISNVSPVAEAILNKEKGDVVTVDVQKKYDIKIVDILNS